MKAGKMILAAEFRAMPSSAVKIASERRCAILVHLAEHGIRSKSHLSVLTFPCATGDVVTTVTLVPNISQRALNYSQDIFDHRKGRNSVVPEPRLHRTCQTPPSYGFGRYGFGFFGPRIAFRATGALWGRATPFSIILVCIQTVSWGVQSSVMRSGLRGPKNPKSSAMKTTTWHCSNVSTLSSRCFVAPGILQSASCAKFSSWSCECQCEFLSEFR